MFSLLWFIIRLRGVHGIRSLIQSRVIPTTHLLDLICLIALWIRLLAVDFAIFGADEVRFFKTIWRAAQAGYGRSMVRDQRRRRLPPRRRVFLHPRANGMAR